MSRTPDHADRIVTVLQASADHLTADERQCMEDGELSGCLVQDGATALALVYEPVAHTHTRRHHECLPSSQTDRRPAPRMSPRGT